MGSLGKARCQRQSCNTCRQTGADGRDGACPGESLKSGAGAEKSGAAVAAHARAHFLDRLSAKQLQFITGLWLTFYQSGPPLRLQRACPCFTVGWSQSAPWLQQHRRLQLRPSSDDSCYYLPHCIRRRILVLHIPGLHPRILVPAHPSAHLLTGQMGASGLHLKANVSIYF